jgi:translation elongation factor EF-4
MANFYVAFELGLAVIPVLNKVDLPHADVDKTMMQLNQMFDIEFEDCLSISAKSGKGVSEVLDEIVHRIPQPKPIDVSGGALWCFDASIGGHSGSTFSLLPKLNVNLSRSN